MFAYVGGYTTADRNGRGDGIHVYRIDSPGADWVHMQHLDGLPNPSLFTLRADGRVLIPCMADVITSRHSPSLQSRANSPCSAACRARATTRSTPRWTPWDGTLWWQITAAAVSR